MVGLDDRYAYSSEGADAVQVIKHGIKKCWEGKEKRPGGANRLAENGGLKRLKGSI